MIARLLLACIRYRVARAERLHAAGRHREARRVADRLMAECDRFRDWQGFA